jgi:hypothetical protein
MPIALSFGMGRREYSSRRLVSVGRTGAEQEVCRRSGGREVADGEGDGEADTEDVDDDADDHYLEGEGVLCRGGERNDNAVHEEVDGSAVEGAGKNGVLEQEGQEAAGEKEDSASGESNEEVAEKAKSGGGDAAVVTARAEEAGGDSLEEAERLEAEVAVDDEGGGDVHGAAEETAGKDGEEGAGLRCGRWSHGCLLLDVGRRERTLRWKPVLLVPR